MYHTFHSYPSYYKYLMYHTYHSYKSHHLDPTSHKSSKNYNTWDSNTLCGKYTLCSGAFQNNSIYIKSIEKLYIRKGWINLCSLSFSQYALRINVLFWADKMIYTMVSNYSIIQWLSQNLWTCCLVRYMKNESETK